MTYKDITTATFVSRPNRFIAKVLINGKEETVHVKNTGRCKELLQKGSKVYLAKADNPNRKTAYDLVSVEKIRKNKPTLFVNMDSQLPNALAAKWILESGIFSKDAILKREVTFSNSRFDLYIEDGKRKAFAEVKGVTLEENGVASFPDAPTQRGTKHLKELMKAIDEGYEAYIIFVIQMKEITLFTPNEKSDKIFAETLRKAKEKGVKILAVDCVVSENNVYCHKEVPISLF